jgi:hypothetical protein
MARSQTGSGIDYIMGKLEGIEGMLARQLTEAQTDRRNAHEHRSAIYKKLEDQGLAIDRVEGRVKALETTVSTMKPTFDEFLLWKERAHTAGWLGRALWITGGVILASAAWVAAQFKGLFGH